MFKRLGTEAHLSLTAHHPPNCAPSTTQQGAHSCDFRRLLGGPRWCMKVLSRSNGDRSGAPQTQRQSCLFSGLARGHLAAVFPREAGPVPREHQVILGLGGRAPVLCNHLAPAVPAPSPLPPKSTVGPAASSGEPRPSGEALRHPAVLSP